MNLTRGERRVIWFLVPIVVALLPPVTNWAAAVRVRVVGIPFVVFWNASVTLVTAVVMTIAFRLREEIDGRDEP